MSAVAAELPEPKIRKDGLCRICGGPRRFDHLKPLYRRALEDDPFCSSKCARAYWGTTLAVDGHAGKKRDE